MQLPLGRMRRSIALYYYSNGRPKTESVRQGLHTTLWQRPLGCGHCAECAAFRPDIVTSAEYTGRKRMVGQSTRAITQSMSYRKLSFEGAQLGKSRTRGIALNGTSI